MSHASPNHSQWKSAGYSLGSYVTNPDQPGGGVSAVSAVTNANGYPNSAARAFSDVTSLGSSSVAKVQTSPMTATIMTTRALTADVAP
jgi:hypothetical protein